MSWLDLLHDVMHLVLVAVGLAAGWWLAKRSAPAWPPYPPFPTPTIHTTTSAPTVPVTVTLRAPETDPEPTIVVTPQNGAITVPPDVVAACIAEARGNHAVLERSLAASADMLALGMTPRDVLVAVQAGDQEVA